MAAVPSDSPLHLESEEVAVESIAHACFRIHSARGSRILIDPYASRVWLGYDFPGELTADAVLITHPHLDHDGGEFIGRKAPWTTEVRVLRDPEATVRPRILIPMHYRHPDLESSADSPRGLGRIDPWLVGRQGVTELTSNYAVFTKRSLTCGERIVVFPHSPKIPAARSRASREGE